MKFPASLAALLLCSLLLMQTGHCSVSPMAAKPIVATRLGDVQGFREQELEVFRGIPFAAPPVGELRWREPRPMIRWSGTRQASSFGNACMQVPGLAMAAGGDPGKFSEDCLYLNVWTPRAAKTQKLPVMVWIHGGALVFGAGSQPLFNGAALARRDMVLITINYRMGALGFFSHPAIAGELAKGPVNFGLLDQIAALRWVRENIAAFGGDPGKVTIFGESAGAQSVLALYASPLAKGLFQQGIAQSPYGIPSNTRAKARATGINIANALGLAGATASAAQLRAIPAARFVKFEDKSLSLAPGFIVGDAALPQSILETFQQRKQAKLPLIIGSNSDEATVALAFGVDPAKLVARLRAGSFLLGKLYPAVTDEAQLGREVVRDMVFTSFARRIAYLHSQSVPTWRYYFSYVQETQQGKIPGVAHGGEIAFVMGTGDSCHCLPMPFTQQDRAVSQTVGDYWVGFARTGKPAARGAPAWPQDATRKSRVMEFAESPVVRDDFMKARLNAFIAFLKTLNALFA